MPDPKYAADQAEADGTAESELPISVEEPIESGDSDA